MAPPPPLPQVWHYREADPDLGAWQAKELLDHLEGVLANEPVEVISGQSIVEVKPQVQNIRVYGVICPSRLMHAVPHPYRDKHPCVRPVAARLATVLLQARQAQLYVSVR